MKFNAYLGFNGQCRTAFEFYQQVFGGKITAMMTVGESPMAAHTPADQHGSIMHARLEVGDQVLMGGDAPAGQWQKPQGLTIAIDVDGVAEAERVFNALAEGGTVSMPLQETFWAERFGMCTDRYGTPWMVNGGAKEMNA